MRIQRWAAAAKQELPPPFPDVCRIGCLRARRLSATWLGMGDCDRHASHTRSRPFQLVGTSYTDVCGLFYFCCYALMFLRQCTNALADALVLFPLVLSILIAVVLVHSVWFISTGPACKFESWRKNPKHSDQQAQNSEALGRALRVFPRSARNTLVFLAQSSGEHRLQLGGTGGCSTTGGNR